MLIKEVGGDIREIRPGMALVGNRLESIEVFPGDLQSEEDWAWFRECIVTCLRPGEFRYRVTPHFRTGT